MCRLSDRDIRSEIEAGTSVIDPFRENQLQPASYDVVLGKGFVEIRKIPGIIDAASKLVMAGTHDYPIQYIDHAYANDFVLEPQGFVLGTTEERVKIGMNVGAKYEGKSSLGRIGLMTHVTAGYIDPGFEGHITVELFNCSPMPIRVRRGMHIGQLAFDYMNTEPEFAYGHAKFGSHYQGQTGVTPAR